MSLFLKPSVSVNEFLKRSQSSPCTLPVMSQRSRRVRMNVVSQLSSQSDMKTVVVKNTPGDLPFPYSEKDPYKLPISIDRVQRLLLSLGWEKPWVDQIVDRIMKNMLRTTEERAQAVIDMLVSVGVRQDEVCNMASISVVLLGLNPETRIKPIVEYLKKRGMPAGAIPDLVLKHPRIFEYKLQEDGSLAKGAARIKVDVLPNPKGEKTAAVTYYRVGASFMSSPVSPLPPLPA